MQDAWRAYLELALGLTEASRRKAEQAARDLLARGGATAAQFQSAVEELLQTSRANRAELVKLIRYEVDRTLGKVGLATVEEVEALSARVRELERRIREQADRQPVPAPGGGEADEAAAALRETTQSAAEPVAAKRAPAKKTAKKAVKKAPAKKTVKKAVKSAPPETGEHTDG
jgi:polyhydroxyalkanoate synthesis regulator phasin